MPPANHPREARRPFDCAESEIRLLLRLRSLCQAGEWDQVDLRLAPLAIVGKRSSRAEQLDHTTPAAPRLPS